MERSDDSDLGLRWSNRLSLKQRILAVNIFAIAMLAGSLFYLDSFRSRLTQARVEQARSEARLIAHVMSVAPLEAQQPLLARFGQYSGVRLRVYDTGGLKRADSWNEVPPTYELRDPDAQPWNLRAAQIMDNVFDTIVRAERPPLLAQVETDTADAWPEAERALSGGQSEVAVRRAPEGSPFISAAAPIEDFPDAVLLLTINAQDITRIVRAERMTLGIVLFVTISLSVLLSLFLARTIAHPLRRLAHAAHRVRLGRDREVDVPLLPARRDEIGRLARALHDMSQSLRHRIDATEAFAADVTHELKNPLASLRSAVETLDRVEDAGLRRQLLDVVRDDVRRLDRLVVDIAEISRLDAELSRTRFEPVDLGQLIESMLSSWETRSEPANVEIVFARPGAGSAVVMGDESRLARAIENIVGNGISFSPQSGLVEIVAARRGAEVVVSIEDEGAGVPEEAREAIFNRFHSIRGEEDFGRHSGLGLAIAKAIVEGHDGRIEVGNRHDGRTGARFVIRIPGAQ